MKIVILSLWLMAILVACSSDKEPLDANDHNGFDTDLEEKDTFGE